MVWLPFERSDENNGKQILKKTKMPECKKQLLKGSQKREVKECNY